MIQISNKIFMGSKLAQVPSSIFFYEDPYSKHLCNPANKHAYRQMLLKLIPHWRRYKFPFLLTKPPHFSDMGGNCPHISKFLDSTLRVIGPYVQLEPYATTWAGPQTLGRIRSWFLSPSRKVLTKTSHLPPSPHGSNRL